MPVTNPSAHAKNILDNHQNMSVDEILIQVEALLGDQKGKEYLAVNADGRAQLQAIYNEAIKDKSDQLFAQNQQIFANFSSQDFNTLKIDRTAADAAKKTSQVYVKDMSVFAAQTKLHDETISKIREELAKESNVEQRALLIQRWVAVLQNSFERGDFSSSIAIFTALKTALIDDKQANVIKTKLSTETHEIIATLNTALGNPASQYTVATNRETPIIPYIPTYLATITLKEDTRELETIEKLLTELNNARDSASKKEIPPLNHSLVQFTATGNVSNNEILPHMAKEIRNQQERIAARSIKETTELLRMTNNKMDKSITKLTNVFANLLKSEKELSKSSKSDRVLSMNIQAVEALVSAFKDQKISATEAHAGLKKIMNTIKSNKQGNPFSRVIRNVQNRFSNQPEVKRHLKSLETEFDALTKIESTRFAYETQLQKLGVNLTITNPQRNSPTTEIYKLLSQNKTTQRVDYNEKNSIKNNPEATQETDLRRDIAPQQEEPSAKKPISSAVEVESSTPRIR